MNCYDCEIEDKLSECCGAHPETGETRLIKIKGNPAYTCPNLNEDGLCNEYENRPEKCQEHFCYKINQTDLCDLFS